MADLVQHYNALAPRRDAYRRKNKYYYSLLFQQYRYLVPPGKKVLEVGCATGDLLDSLKPSVGVGLDLSPEMIKIAEKKFPHLKFRCADVAVSGLSEKFDYIVLSGVLGESDDVQKLLESLKLLCHTHTRVIIEYYSYLWQYILKWGEKLNLKIPQKLQNWLVSHDIENFLTIAGFEPIKKDKRILCPVFIPGVSFLLNKFITPLPVFNALTLNHFIVARPAAAGPQKEFSVTILVPCRNEKGNIEQVITRTPSFGTSQEFIFVEGFSKDGTYEEVERVIRKYPQKDIKLFKQPGKGKGDAVRFGFSKASGDILMILDADLTVPPEELPKFYAALKTNKGEFINGSRLVYPLEKEAMRFLNLIVNKFFGVFFSWLLGQRFKDTLCGTKVLFRNHYEEIAAQRSYFGDFDPFGDFDLIFGAVKLNLKIIELPIHYKERTYGTTQIQRFRHGLLLFRMCWFAMKKIKFR